jgi:hypothetical protein
MSGDPSSDRGNETIPAGTGFIVRKAGTSNGQTVFWTNSMPIAPLRAVSRKAHGNAGNFDVELPASGDGIECRRGQGTNSDQHQLVLTFPSAVTVPSASVTSGTASVASITGSGTDTITINLTGVTNAQRITVTLANVTDNINTNDVAIRFGVLVGDATNDGAVNSSDISYVKSKSGSLLNYSSFRADLTVDENINSSDISFVKSKSGTALP